MVVYIVTRHVRYEGFNIVTVCTTEKVARSSVWYLVEQALLKDDGRDTTAFFEEQRHYEERQEIYTDDDDKDQWYRIQEWTVMPS